MPTPPNRPQRRADTAHALRAIALAWALASAPALAEPIDTLREAAQSGDPAAQARLGSRLYRGDGVPRNLVTAYRWLLRAAEQGSVTAQTGLAVLYYNGEGTPQHLVEALKWALIAAQAGDADAILHRDYLLQRLAPHQVREARRLAATWVPKPESATR